MTSRSNGNEGSIERFVPKTNGVRNELTDDDLSGPSSIFLIRKQIEFIVSRNTGRYKIVPYTKGEKCEMCNYCEVYDLNATGAARRPIPGKFILKCNKCPGCKTFLLDTFDEGRRPYLNNLYKNKLSLKTDKGFPSCLKLCFGCCIYGPQIPNKGETEKEKKAESAKLTLPPCPLKAEEKNIVFDDGWYDNDKDYEVCDGPNTWEYLYTKQKEFLINRQSGKIEDNPATSSEKCQQCLFCDVFDASRISESVPKVEDGNNNGNIQTKLKKCPGCKYYKIEEQNNHVKAFLRFRFRSVMAYRAKPGIHSKKCYGCCLFG